MGTADRDERNGATLLQGKAEASGPAWSGEEMAERSPPMSISI